MSPAELDSINATATHLVLEEANKLAIQEQYQFDSCGPDKLILLMMYAYAAETWEQDSEGNSAQFANCITEQQMYAIKSKLNQLS